MNFDDTPKRPWPAHRNSLAPWHTGDDAEAVERAREARKPNGKAKYLPRKTAPVPVDNSDLRSR